MADKKQTVTTKYGTKIDVTGLNPDQVKQVLSVAQDKGAYGAKGAALAKTYQQKNGTQTTPASNKSIPGSSNNPGTPTNPDVNNPITTNTTIDPNNGKITDPNQLLANSPKLPGATDLQGDVNDARNAAYGYLTQYNSQDKAKEIEDAKQELANRGIPISYSNDPNRPSLWEQTMQSIDRKYQSLDDQAHNQAIQAGNSILTSESGVAKNASDAFIQAVLGMSDEDLKKYGIDKDYQAKLQAIAASNAGRSGGGGRSSGGSSGGGGSQSPIIGGTAPGFNV